MTENVERSLGSTVIIVTGPGGKIAILRDPSHKDPLWKLPGGHVEEGEGVPNCAKRELKEETCLSIDGNGGKIFHLFSILKNPGLENEHYLHVYYGEVLSWRDLGKGTRGEEPFLSSFEEIESAYHRNDFVRGHYGILERARRVLREKGVKI